MCIDKEKDNNKTFFCRLTKEIYTLYRYAHSHRLTEEQWSAAEHTYSFREGNLTTIAAQGRPTRIIFICTVSLLNELNRNAHDALRTPQCYETAPFRDDLSYFISINNFTEGDRVICTSIHPASGCSSSFSDIVGSCELKCPIMATVPCSSRSPFGVPNHPF